MTQVSETLQKLSGGEGGIARGRARPLVLRFAPDRRGPTAASKNRFAIFVEPTETQIEVSKLLKTWGPTSPGIPSPPRFWQ